MMYIRTIMACTSTQVIIALIVILIAIVVMTRGHISGGHEGYAGPDDDEGIQRVNTKDTPWIIVPAQAPHLPENLRIRRRIIRL
jgi:hypothetical protein